MLARIDAEAGKQSRIVISPVHRHAKSEGGWVVFALRCRQASMTLKLSLHMYVTKRAPERCNGVMSMHGALSESLSEIAGSGSFQPSARETRRELRWPHRPRRHDAHWPEASLYCSP